MMLLGDHLQIFAHTDIPCVDLTCVLTNSAVLAGVPTSKGLLPLASCDIGSKMNMPTDDDTCGKSYTQEHQSRWPLQDATH